MSKNSLSGIWEIDGAAKVSEDGMRVETKPGMGITHFSEIYAAPLGPNISSFNIEATPGADAFNGSLTTSIEPPSYKTMGLDLAPGLTYKSSWASPTALVTNLFDIPRNEVTLVENQYQTARNVFVTTPADVTTTSWIEPEYITAQFFSGNIQTEKLKFTGMPNKSLISYAVDVQSLGSGVFPYSARYEIKLKHMTLRTVRLEYKQCGIPFTSCKNIVSQSTNQASREIEKVFPEDVSGSLFLQNKVDSSVGRGWKIKGPQRILNPDSSRLLVEGGAGDISSYTVSEDISTVLEDSNGLQGVSFSNYPQITYIDNSNQLRKYDVISGENSVAEVGLDGWHGVSVYGTVTSYPICQAIGRNYTRDRDADSLLALPDGTVYGTDGEANVFQFSDDAFSIIAGTNPGAQSTAGLQGSAAGVNAFCAQSGYSCGGFYVVDQTTIVGGNCSLSIPRSHVPGSGFNDGALNSSSLNAPKDIISGAGNYLLVADSGNNRVRKIDLTNNLITTIAGNGQNTDMGDGGLATDASIYHPRGLALDGQGNLFISTENGLIRRVDTTGVIERYAGRLVQEGGVLADEASAEEMLFNKPEGLVVDTENDYLYVADVGHNRIVRIDMLTKKAKVVAGNGTCVNGDIGDNSPALAASLCAPTKVGLDENKNLLIADSGHKRIRKVVFASSGDSALTYKPTGRQDNSSLIRESDGTFTRIYRDGSFSRFSNEGLEIASISRVGLETSFLYDEQKRLITMIDPTGGEVLYSYSGDMLSSIIDPAGRQTNFYYDGNFLSQVIFPNGESRSYQYDENGLLIQETNERGFATTYQYNQWNRLAKVVRSDNSTIEINDMKSKTVGNSYVAGAVGVLQSIDDEELYDGIKKPNGVETKFKIDETGYVSTIIDGDGRLTNIERDHQGRALKIIRPDGSIAEFSYSADTGDLISKVDNDLTTNYQFNSYGDLLRQENSLGQWIQNVFEGSTGLLLSSTNHAGQITSATYTEAGLVATRTNAIGATTSYGHDQYLNIASITDALNNTTIYERDVAGNVIKSTNANGQFTQNSFDLFNRLLSASDARGNTTNYEYLATGELSKIIDPRGNQTLFAYNSLGQMVEKTDPLGFKTALSYDLNGNVLTELDPNGNLKTFEYNSRDELVKKVLPDNVYEMTYDSYGNLERIEDKNSVIEYTFERVAKEFKVEEEVWTGRGDLSGMGEHVLIHSYNSLGLATNSSTIIGNFSYAYDNANRLNAILNPFNEEFQFDFDLANRLTKISRPGSVTHHIFDAANFLKEIRHENLSSDVIGKFEYARDAIGNRTAMRSPAGENQFNYDPDQQITSSVGPDVGSESFQYDELGNRMQDAGGAYVYGEKRQRLIEDYRHFYYYDNNGNLSSKISKDMTKTESYHYSSENQLIKIEWFENNVLLKEAKYSFDALGRRMQKVVIDHQSSTDKTRRFAYIGQEVIAQLDESNMLLAAYTPSGLRTDDTLSVKLTSAGVAAGLGTTTDTLDYLKDGLGSITHLANSSGVVKERYLYSAFGNLREILDGSGVATNSPILEPYHSYTNRELDNESGLYFYRARVYSSELGRFFQTDSHPGVTASPSTHINKFSYALNNPLKYSDPSGRFVFTLSGLLIAAAIAGGISAGMYAIQAESFSWGDFGKSFASGFVTGALIYGGAWGLTAYLGVGAGAGALGGGLGGLAGSVTNSLITGAQWSWTTALIYTFAGALSGGVMGFLAGKAVPGSNTAVNTNDFNRNVSTSLDLSGSSEVGASGVDLYGGDPNWHMYDAPWQHNPWPAPINPVPFLP